MDAHHAADDAEGHALMDAAVMDGPMSTAVAKVRRAIARAAEADANRAKYTVVIGYLEDVIDEGELSHLAGTKLADEHLIDEARKALWHAARVRNQIPSPFILVQLVPGELKIIDLANIIFAELEILFGLRSPWRWDAIDEDRALGVADD